MALATKPTLTSARLILRPVTSQDVDPLFNLDQDPEVRRFVHMPDPPTLADVRDQLIPRWQNYDLETPAVGYWVAELTLTEDHKFLGWFHLRPPGPGTPAMPDELELGYRLRRDVWGRGYATEGGRLLQDYAFKQLNANCVIAAALEANTASIRVMEKLGMSLRTRWLYKEQLPAVVYAITALWVA
jgi:RimJ/RimL family protein N-acetyltransferase